jgi:WD40 repeat protein
VSVPGRLTSRGSIQLREYPVDAVWSPDGRSILVGLADGSLAVVQPAMTQAPRYVHAHAQGLLALAWHKGGKFWASSGQDGSVLLWDVRTETPQQIHHDAQWSERLAFAERGSALAVATGRTLRIFDEAAKLRYEHASAAGVITALVWHPRNVELASVGNGGALVHRPQLGQGPASAPRSASAPEPRALPLRAACVCVAFHPEGRVLVAGLQEGSAHLWNLATGSESSLDGHGSRVLATEWSASGRYLATAAGNVLALWDFGGRGSLSAEVRRLEAHTDRLTAIAFRPGGNGLASAALDRRLLWWRPGASDSPQDAHLLPEECSLLRFSRDGTHLAVGDASGALSIFRCEP